MHTVSPVILGTLGHCMLHLEVVPQLMNVQLHGPQVWTPLGLVWGCLALQLARLQCLVELRADDVNLGLIVLQYLLGLQQQLPVLGATIAVSGSCFLTPVSPSA